MRQLPFNFTILTHQDVRIPHFSVTVFKLFPIHCCPPCMQSVKAPLPRAQFGKAVPGVHYRLDLKDVPFVVGKVGGARGGHSQVSRHSDLFIMYTLNQVLLP